MQSNLFESPTFEAEPDFMVVLLRRYFYRGVIFILETNAKLYTLVLLH